VRFASRRIFQVTLRKGRITSGNLLSVFMARMITCGHIGEGLDQLMNFLVVIFFKKCQIEMNIFVFGILYLLAVLLCITRCGLFISLRNL